MHVQGTLTEVWSAEEHIFKSWSHAREWLDRKGCMADSPTRKHAFVANTGEVYLLGTAQLAKPLKFTKL